MSSKQRSSREDESSSAEEHAKITGEKRKQEPTRRVPPAQRPKESNELRIKQRQKQIQFGKNTIGYQRYLEQISRYGFCIVWLLLIAVGTERSEIGREIR